MAVLKNLDQKAEEKGSKAVTAWQLIKFLTVSLLTTVVQYATLNILYIVPAIKALESQPFSWFVFSYGVDAGGLKAFIALNTANVLAK